MVALFVERDAVRNIVAMLLVSTATGVTIDARGVKILYRKGILTQKLI